VMCIVVDGGGWWRLDGGQDGGWVDVSSGAGSPGWSRTKGHKTTVVIIVLVVKLPTTPYNVTTLPCEIQ